MHTIPFNILNILSVQFSSIKCIYVIVQPVSRILCFSLLCVAVTKRLDRNNSEEKKFILVHSFRGSVHSQPTS